MAKRKANKMRMYTREVKELCDEFDFEYDEDNPLDTVGEIIRYVLNDDAYEDEPLSEAEFDKLPDAKVHMLENLLDAWNDKNLEILEEEEEEEEEAPPKATRRRGGRKAKVKADEEQEEEEQEESSTSNTAALMTKFHEYRDQIMELLDQIEESITTIGDVSESEEEEEEEAPPKTTRRKSSNGRRKKKAAKKKRVAKKRTTKKRGKKKSKRGSSRR